MITKGAVLPSNYKESFHTWCLQGELSFLVITMRALLHGDYKGSCILLGDYKGNCILTGDYKGNCILPGDYKGNCILPGDYRGNCITW